MFVLLRVRLSPKALRSAQVGVDSKTADVYLSRLPTPQVTNDDDVSGPWMNANCDFFENMLTTHVFVVLPLSWILLLGLADTEGDDEKNIPILKEYIRSVGTRLGINAFLLVFKIDSGYVELDQYDASGVVC